MGMLACPMCLVVWHAELREEGGPMGNPCAHANECMLCVQRKASGDYLGNPIMFHRLTESGL